MNFLFRLKSLTLNTYVNLSICTYAASAYLLECAYFTPNDHTNKFGPEVIGASLSKPHTDE